MALVVLLFLLALILPNKYHITKTIIVNSSTENSFELVANLNHYHSWNPWAKMEPTAEHQILGTPKTIGHQYSWDGKKIGTGGLTITSINEPNSIELELAFLKPFASTAIDKWAFEQLPNNQTKITWINYGDLAFPMARLMGPMINKNLNKQFEQGLLNIKSLCEK